MVIDEVLPDDIKLLKEEIRRLKLKIELQDIIIDVSGKDLKEIKVAPYSFQLRPSFKNLYPFTFRL